MGLCGSFEENKDNHETQGGSKNDKPITDSGIFHPTNSSIEPKGSPTERGYRYGVELILKYKNGKTEDLGRKSIEADTDAGCLNICKRGTDEKIFTINNWDRDNIKLSKSSPWRVILIVLDSDKADLKEFIIDCGKQKHNKADAIVWRDWLE